MSTLKLTYSLNTDDFLAFQMFAASKSDRINRKKRNGWLLLTVGSFIACLIFYLQEDLILAAYFAVCAVVAGFFYPHYFRWRHKRHYQRYVEDVYRNRIGEDVNLELSDEVIFMQSDVGDSRIKTSEIEHANEWTDHFFIEMSSGHSIIIPKSQLEDADEVRAFLESIGILVNDETQWKWRY